jgi:putative ABC transport system permease protein
LKISGVKSASYSKRVPGGNFDDVHSIMLDANNTVVFAAFTVDEDYKETLGLKMTAGEWFKDELVTSDSLVMINHAAAQVLGLENPVGEVIGNYYQVIGVVEDFHYGALRNEIGPALFTYSAADGGTLAIRLDVNKTPNAAIANVWNQFTALPLESKMLEQNFDAQFQKEAHSANIVLAFTFLAILISCIGLFGLAAFTADQRLHEFGIRKVLGARVSDIVGLFSFDFLKLIGIAFFISIPLAIWGVNVWLQSFADRISLSVGAFILAGILALTIAFLTILFQSLKAGRLNPVDTLRNE